MEIKSFLKDFGTPGVALIALVQPWLMWAWKKFFRQGQVEIYETGVVEVGYSIYGPTIGMHGTLRALHGGSFVRSLTLQVTKKKDSSKHLFEWGAFRSQKLKVGFGEETLVELPSGFFLETNQPHRYNMVFFDLDARKEIQTTLQDVKRAWEKSFMDAGGNRLLEANVDLSAIYQELQTALESLYKDFSKTAEHTCAFEELRRLCYWEPGQYHLASTVHVARPDKMFFKEWDFEITKEDFDRLRINVLAMLREACGRASGNYDFAYPNYKKSNEHSKI